MEIGAIFLLLALLIFVTLFVARPFTSRWRVKVQSSPEVSALLAERERTLTALMELDFDNGIGKIPAEEYTSQRASLLQKGSEVLRHLDAIQGKPAINKDEAFERLATEQNEDILSEEDLEELIAKRRTAHREKTAGFCPNCGKPILQSDKYCPSCGQPVNSK